MPTQGFLQVRFVLRGNLSESALAAAWQQVANRHEAMRMSLQTLKTLKQVLVTKQTCDANVTWHDLRQSSSVEQQKWMTDFLQRDRHTGLDLSKSPVSRLTAIRMADDAYSFVWTCHHLLLDGWSAIVILQDLLRFYESQRTAAPADFKTTACLRRLSELGQAAKQVRFD